MPQFSRRVFLAGAVLALAGCGRDRASSRGRASYRDDRQLYPNETPQLRQLIEKYAARYEVPVDLVQRVVVRESTHRPEARNGPYYGLMQILPQTARTMGYRGPASGLLDAETNLKYAVKYLRGAWLLADGSHDRAVQWYARGYYYEAKRRGMLQETGLRA
ncbi:Transglycosylase SLT domain-containing protein [Salinihabitans flavidus]|uniref:Transglycosylase SLT domain-containing protein n=1 Tax=Salinihabitans flavidus TaxID=569882 RepID=A0A1H8SCI2_9RHOB|nr:lytic transglycosylase domain-containing protein [Salinihabitans flavidus]SEO75893.1 Transglycosylase SLT domain-containing protein [Salinihabitans flavidus]